MAQEWSLVGIEHVQIPAADGNYSVNVPAGTQEGDMMVLFAAVKDIDNQIVDIGNPTAGTWTSVVEEDFTDSQSTTLKFEFQLWYKRATASEPASYTCSFTSAGTINGGVFVLLVLRNIGNFDVFAGPNTATNTTIHQAPSISPTQDDSCYLHVTMITNIDTIHVDGTTWSPVTSGLTEVLDHNGLIGMFVGTRNVAAGATGTSRVDTGTACNTRSYAFAFRGLVVGDANLQGVAVPSFEGSYQAAAEAGLQAVADLSPDASLLLGAQGLLQAVGRLIADAEGIRFLDFSRFDAYIESPLRSQGLLFYDELQPETVARRLQPIRTDVGDNPDEIRPDFGNFFAQSDFSHGMGQRNFHRPGRDPAKFWWSEGFDISEPGRLRHLRVLAQAFASANIGALAQVGGLPFVADGTGVKRGDGSFPGVWTAEDPHAGETATTVEDLAAEGARLFAALGANGVHVRDAAGTWAHFKPDGTNNLNITPATRVAWVKDRLMVVGGTGSRSIYEVTSSSSPTALETLPEGWRFEHVFEAGGFIHACAVNTDAGLSRIHHYGLNSAGTALEKKSSTPLPKDQLAFVGAGYLGLAFLGVGRKNSSGFDPILYRATIREGTGELDYIEIREETGSGANDLGVRAIAPMGETILAGWSLGSGAFGGARDGIAVYHLARDAFAHHLKTAGGGGARRVLDIMPFGGRILVSLAGAGLYYEDLATYVSQAQLVTSLGDFNNAGPKIWDLVEVAHDALPSGTSVKVEYGTAAQESATWAEVFTSADANSEGKSGRLSNVRARLFALRISSNALASAAPVVRSYAVRGNPSPLTPEFQLTRYIRLLAKDRKDDQAELVYQDPREVLRWLQDQLWSFVNFHESGFDWIVWLEDVSTVEPAQPFYDTTSGEPLEDAFVVRLVMTGTR